MAQNAQQWLNNVLPNQSERKKITHLLISANNPLWELLELEEDEKPKSDTWKSFKATLEGTLDLNDFTSLEKLYLGGGSLVGLKVDQCQQLEYLDISNEYGLTSLTIGDNQNLITLKSWQLTPFKFLTNKLKLVKQKLTKWTNLLTKN